MRLFQRSLKGIALQWYTSLDLNTIKTSGPVITDVYRSLFIQSVPKKDDLEALTQNPGESFSAYVGRWRTMAFQVKNKPPEDEQMDMIIRSANPAIY